MTTSLPPLPGSQDTAPDGARARGVSAMFTRIAGRYDQMNSLMTGGMHHLWRAQAARIATERRPRLLLDVATGTGDFAIALARRPNAARVVGVDFVPPMVAIAARKGARRRQHPALRWAVGDALRLPFPDGIFGAATVGWGVRNFASLDDGLRELVRVLYPGGRLVILEMTPVPPGGPAAAVGFYARRVVPLLGALAARDRTAYTYLPESAQAFPPAAELATRMEAAGLEQVRYRSVGFGAVAIHWGDKPG